MHYLLSRECRPILTTLAQDKTLCAFDFDGTLAPIALHPDQAVMSDRTKDLLCRVAAVYPCIVVSGRARADVFSKLRGAHLEAVIGNHGAEGEETQYADRSKVHNWAAAIEGAVESMPGVWVENKGLSLAVHYRQAREKARARRQAAQAVRKLDGAIMLPGKEVINVMLAGAPNKGDAVATQRERLHCSRVLFTGDDDNDEDVFALSGYTIGVRVGRKDSSKARYYLRNRAEVDCLLELMISLRTS